MTFFNKKQEVIDIQLTRFGKNLLSRGAFKPVYYQFFDDDVIYDISRANSSEEQNEAETRIKEGVRLRTQHTTVGLETSFKEQKKLIEEGKRGVFLKMRRQADPLEKDKLLKYPLSNTKPGAQEAPSFVLHAKAAEISGSTVTYPDPTGSYPFKNRPTLTIKPKYEYVIDRRNISEPEDVLYDSETFVDLTKEKIEFLDGSTIELIKKDLIIDLEELVSSYGLDNFEIEIYEETEKGSEQYVQILEEEEVYNLLNIETDETVKEVKVYPDKSKNFFSE